MEEKSVLDILFDENNDENIVVFDAEDNPFEFEQVAVIPFDGKVYAILKPVELFDGMQEDEAIVFLITEDETLEIEMDDEIIDKVFDIYEAMVDEASGE